LARGDADEPFEVTREVTLAAKAGFGGHFGQGPTGRDEALGLADAQAVEVGVRRQADLSAKGPQQVVRAEADVPAISARLTPSAKRSSM
jgi:hypothetical protein